MNRQKMIRQTIAMRTGIQTMNREGEYWDSEGQEFLRARFLSGIPVNEIATELERSEEEVYCQIERMQLYATPSRIRRKSYSSCGGYVHFRDFGISDYSASGSLLHQHHFKEGYVDV